jgi:hypothetical protein
LRYEPDLQCSLPHAVDLEMRPIGVPPTQMKIEVGRYSINQLLSDRQTLFAMPRDGSEEVLDLSRIGTVAEGPLDRQAADRGTPREPLRSE